MNKTSWKYLWTNASTLGPKIWGTPIITSKWEPCPESACVIDIVDRDERHYPVYSFEIDGHRFKIACGERSPGIDAVYAPEEELDFYDTTDEKTVKGT